MRGSDTTLVSPDEFKKDIAALSPSAFRKAVAGLKPPPASLISFGHRVDSGGDSDTSSVTGSTWRLLPQATCWFWSVPAQLMPFMVLGFNVVSKIFASIKTC